MSARFQFLFAVCQRGAEDALKAEVAREWPGFRFAFSRPGFVTFKFPSDFSPSEDFDLRSVFARTHGFSLGHLQGSSAELLAPGVWSLAAELPIDHLHVWQRDAALPGEGSFEPGPTPLTEEIGRILAAAAPDGESRPELSLNQIAKARQAVLDCIIVEPNQWWIGWHRAGAIPSRWPGGVPPIDRSGEVISRAYYKMAEALLWSRLPIKPDDVCAELGSAPGGAAQWLLEHGMRVLGIDPAEMDERLLEHPRFCHIRRRAREVRHRDFDSVRWLLADSNVAPQHTLDSVEAILAHASSHIRGLLLTLKLPDWALAEQIPAYLERVRSWGYTDVRARQLAFNRQEFCVCAVRGRRPPQAAPRRAGTSRNRARVIE